MTLFFSLSPQSVLLLGAVALVCLALDLLFLLFYSFWLCCRRRKNQDSPNADCCCTAWCVIIATLVCRFVVCTPTQLNTKHSTPCCLHPHVMWQYTTEIHHRTSTQIKLSMKSIQLGTFWLCSET